MKKNVFKRLTAIIMICAIMIPLFAGCSSKKKDTETTTKDTGTHVITDHAGNKVTVPDKIDKIAVVGIYPLPSVISVFFDSADKIVAMPKQSMIAAKNSLLSELYPEILNANTDVIDGNTVNVEELIKLDPDVVFYGASDTEIGETLRNAGFAAVGVSVNKWNYNCIETLNNWILLLDEIFPENDKADIVKEYSNNIYDMIQKRVATLSADEKQRVFFLFQYDDSTLLTSGKNFFGEWWAEAIGAVNVGEELTTDNSVAVNMEQIYKWNPSLIFITNFTTATADDLYKNSIGNYDWSGVTAVKNKQVYKMPLGMYRSYTPGVDTPITLLWLASTAYPKLFSDIDITKETKDYYKKVFGIELTDKQAESIFAPATEAGSGF